MSATGVETPVLEPAAQAFAEATANPPFLFQIPVADGRKAVDEVQSGEIAKQEIDEEWVHVAGGPTGEVPVRIVKPRGTTGTLPVVVYLHGAGWVFGDAFTHDRLVRELAVGVDAAVVFPDYSRSPEARYPIAIEQNYTVARWVETDGAGEGLDASRIAAAGDSVGGNMTAALTLMAKERGGPQLAAQVLFYPVTDARFDTSLGRRTESVVPPRGGLVIEIVPPSASTRSVRPRMPEPRPASTPPMPSSRTSSVRTPSSCAAISSTTFACACLATLVSASEAM